MLGDVFDVMSMVASTVGFLLLIFGPQQRGRGLLAIGAGLGSAGNALHGARFGASWCAALCAVWTWQWWNGGGGDGTKRRLRSLARVFRGVRRTAPVTGGAS